MINEMKDVCHLGAEGIPLVSGCDVFEHTPHTCNAVYLPVSDRRPKTLFLIRNFCETLLFVSCTSRQLEQVFVIPKTLLLFSYNFSGHHAFVILFRTHALVNNVDRTMKFGRLVEIKPEPILRGRARCRAPHAIQLVRKGVLADALHIEDHLRDGTVKSRRRRIHHDRTIVSLALSPKGCQDLTWWMFSLQAAPTDPNGSLEALGDVIDDPCRDKHTEADAHQGQVNGSVCCDRHGPSNSAIPHPERSVTGWAAIQAGCPTRTKRPQRRETESRTHSEETHEEELQHINSSEVAHVRDEDVARICSVQFSFGTKHIPKNTCLLGRFIGCFK